LDFVEKNSFYCKNTEPPENAAIFWKMQNMADFERQQLQNYWPNRKNVTTT
jgi:hypothetical protein